MLAGYSFRPRGWALALAGAGCVAFIALGNWQARRAEEKRAAAASVERATLTGRFIRTHTVLLDNKVRQGRAGYEVVMPLRMRDSDLHVLVNRGWLPAPASRQQVPEVQTSAKDVVISGVWKERFPRPLQLGDNPGGTVRQTLDIAGYAAETGLRLAPRYLEQHSHLSDGLVREWPAPDAGVDKHESYSLQWYSLAVLAAALGLIFCFRRVAAH
jgi:surfeit locus 1 family protein